MILRKKCLHGIKTSESGNKKKVMPEFYGKQNFKGILLFDLIRRSLEFFRILRKNRDDFLGFGRIRLMREITTSRVSPLLVMTIQHLEKGNVIIGRVRRTDNLSLIKKEAAEVLGSCVASPRMTVEKGYCHLEPRAIARGCKDLINKCRDCIELTRLKQVRIKLKRDLYGDFACAQPLKMTMIICFVLSISVTSESLAACNTGDFSCNGKTGASAYCCYHVVSQDSDGNKNIEIYKDKDAPEGAKASVGENAFKNKGLANVNIGSDVTAIKYEAFRGSSVVTLTMSDIETIEAMAFYYATNITSVSMPNVKTIAAKAFWSASKLKNIDVPKAQEIALTAFGDKRHFNYLGLPDSANVTINTNDYGCIKISGCKTIKDSQGQDYKICGTCDDYVKSGTGCVKDCGKGYLGKEGKCIDSSLGCGNGYKDMGGFCNRVRYTPAEAAEIAKDDGNVVTITFRK